VLPNVAGASGVSVLIGTAPFNVLVEPLVVPVAPPITAPTDKLTDADVEAVPAGAVFVTFVMVGVLPELTFRVTV
jgi:hypothetical protein